MTSRLKASASAKQALAGSPRTTRKTAVGKSGSATKKVARHVDAKVAARNSALNAMVRYRHGSDSRAAG